VRAQVAVTTTPEPVTLAAGVSAMLVLPIEATLIKMFPAKYVVRATSDEDNAATDILDSLFVDISNPIDNAGGLPAVKIPADPRLELLSFHAAKAVDDVTADNDKY
jgi:hypothetical protein